MCSQKNRGGTLKETTLWTNPSPTSNFDTQDVTLSDDYTNYDYVKFYVRTSTTNATLGEVIYPSNMLTQSTANQGIQCFMGARPSSNYVRLLRHVANNKIHIHIAEPPASSGSSTTAAIPTKITGCKL